jgi:hypothetical protein
LTKQFEAVHGADIIFGLFKRKTKTPNVAVYVLAVVRDGNALTTPVGIMPQPSPEVENRLKNSHYSKEGSYVSDEIGKATVTYAWNDGEISAACFLSVDDLAHCPGFIPFKEADYDQLSAALSHFPRA